MAIIPGMEGVNFAPVLAKTMYWMGIVILSIIILAVLWMAWRMSSFKIKVTVYPLFGSGIGNDVSIGKPKYNRVRWNKQHTSWQTMKPFMNQKDREPIDPTFIYPGNCVNVYEINDEWVPIKHEIDLEGAKGALKMVPHSMRAWQSQVHKRNAEKYAKIDFWSENKYLFITIGCVLACCALALGTIWLAFKFAQPASENMASLTDAIKNMNMIPGIKPG